MKRILLFILFSANFFAQEVAVTAENASATRLRAMVEHLAQAPRSYLDPESLHAAADWIEKSLRELDLPVKRQPLPVKGEVFHNIIAHLGPASGPRIVIGAHYDTEPGTPGADDNASGIAVLLLLAERLRELDEWACRVDLVAFVLEEYPFFRTEQMGSMVHSKSLKDEGVTVRAMLSLEMLGYFSDLPDSQRYPDPNMAEIYGTKGDFITVVGRYGRDNKLVMRVANAFEEATDLPVVPYMAIEGAPDIDRSDHQSYWRQGYQAVMVSDSSEYRNPNYHKPGDHPETLDYHRMGKVVDALAEFVESFSCAP